MQKLPQKGALQLDLFKSKYKIFIDKAFDWEIWENETGEIINISPACKDVSGYSVDEFLDNKNLFDSIVLESDRDVWFNHRHDALVGKKTSKLEFRIRHKNGDIIWIEHICSPIIDENGKYLGHIANNRDITLRKSMELEIQNSEEKYRILAENVSDVIWVYNVKQKKFTYVSQAIKSLLGYTPEDYLEKSFEEILTPESLKLVEYRIKRDTEIFKNSSGRDNSFLMEIQQYNRDGEKIWVETSTKFRYNSNNHIEILGLSRNIDERKKTEEQIMYLSYYDQLTGLYNRRFYEEELSRLNNSRTIPISLIIADINGLKLANDAFGHIVGDELLKAFADVLKKCSRSGDVVARIAGDEFAILLPNTTLKETKEIVKRINKVMDQKHINNIILSASFGYHTKNKAEVDMEDVFVKAEDNMYKSKLAYSNEMKKRTIELIIANLFDKSPREKEHSRAVSQLCENMALALNLSNNKVEKLKDLGLFHDIGKISVDGDILNKKGRLSRVEYYKIKKHSEVGYQILRAVNEYNHLAEFVLNHHEWIDGRGYPQGVKGNEIPLEAKILAIADAYDCMINSNSYKEPMSVEEAIKELRRNSGTQFDSKLVNIFIKDVIGREYAN